MQLIRLLKLFYLMNMNTMTYPVINCIEILAPSVNMTVTNETLSFACKQFCLNPQFCPPFISLSDQDRISPYIINTISSRQVMRILKKGQLGYH